MSQLVGRVPGFIFIPPYLVFFGTSLVLAPTSRSAETVYFRTPSHLTGSSLHAKKNRTNQSLLLMEQLVVFVGQFSSHHFRPVFFRRLTVVDFFRRLPHFVGLFSLHPLTQ